ncbi:transmembrane 4 L6 family member 18 [Pseudophryne corroboree]|uniref:transmembrane 4 L6 family member 18 n=1 Tax=Pseudophryne corroboree TaxID=495146 RepID=UPI003081CD8E
MSLRSCSEYSVLAIFPLAVCSLVVNILLYFPNGDTTYAGSNQLTNYVWFFEGICFGGIMMIIVAAVLLLVDFYKCGTSFGARTKGCSRLGSIGFALLGVLFSGYSLIISSLGLAQGPYCMTVTGWSYPFTAGSYLVDYSTWSQCLEPPYVVEWNVILFSILIVLSSLQVIICLGKAILDVIAMLCGTHRILIEPHSI